MISTIIEDIEETNGFVMSDFHAPTSILSVVMSIVDVNAVIMDRRAHDRLDYAVTEHL